MRRSLRGGRAVAMFLLVSIPLLAASFRAVPESAFDAILVLPAQGPEPDCKCAASPVSQSSFRLITPGLGSTGHTPTPCPCQRFSYWCFVCLTCKEIEDLCVTASVEAFGYEDGECALGPASTSTSCTSDVGKDCCWYVSLEITRDDCCDDSLCGAAVMTRSVASAVPTT